MMRHRPYKSKGPASGRRKASGGNPYRQLLLALLLTGIGLAVIACQLLPQDRINGSRPTGPASETDPTGETEPEIRSHPILINEVMATNRMTLQTADGAFPDWIELYNSGPKPVDLEGYGLSDRLDEPQRWIFPALVLEPGAYQIIYASGLDTDLEPEQEQAGEIHTSFRLSRSGEELVFSDPAGRLLAYINLPELEEDLSYGLLDDARDAHAPYYYLREPSPGLPNGLVGYDDPTAARPAPVYHLLINEYISRNASYPDLDGDLSDWAELYHAGDQVIDLAGFGFSDNPNQPFKWIFPAIQLEPGEYLLVWLSGKEKDYQPGNPATLHATFSLGADDEALLITDPRGYLVDQVELEYLPLQISRGRCPNHPDTWYYYPRPTPGEPNNTVGHESIEGAMSLQSRGIWINEVSTIDSERVRRETIRQPDWIELYNGSDSAVDLEGYGLSDRQDDLYRMVLSGLVIEPGEYLVIHPDTFGLSASGETLWLSAPGHDLVDWFETGMIPNGMSSGRGHPGADAPAEQRYFFPEPTPGRANSGLALKGQAIRPTIRAVDPASGLEQPLLYFDGELDIYLESPQPDAVIRYTLDGSLPQAQSPVYSGPIRISRNTVLRCYSAIDDSLPSASASRTWLTGVRHDLPVMSLQLDHADFYDPVIGVYGNYTSVIEQQADFEYYETDGRLGIDFTAGLTLHGSFSRRELQKSMQIRLRAMYGEPQIIYPFFDGNPVSSHKRLILRTSGQDWRISKLRDAFMTNLIKAHTAQDTMDVQPCVVYVNGSYFGLYEVREKVSKHYAASHHGADPDLIDLIKGNRIVLSGNMQAYDALLRYVRNHDMRDPDHYAYVMSQIDAESLMDFLITQSFFSNADSGNKKFWRERSEDGRWRWVFFDLDWGLFPETYRYNFLRNDLLHPDGHGHARIFDTSLQIRLMQNPDFRQKFIERYAWYMNEVFVTEAMLELLDEMAEEIRSEMPRQIDRWGRPVSMEQWEFNVSELRRVVSEKRDLSLNAIQATFNLDQAEMQTLFPEDYR